ncbi:MAG: DNA-binding protein [Bacteroidetes bacterium HGW-Bacteroidetes-6]|jgi:transcriptional regulator with XRE-family HTH domain|nr:MAG: DNA-binding protein [Bacteroidetes bacterium HGW-Bacteroidetes-6]
MSHFLPSNIRFLRKRKSLTQEELALAVSMNRSTLSGYENQVAEPGIDEIIRLSSFFHVSIDTLLTSDFSTLSEYQIRQMELGSDPYIRGSNLRVLATTVDSGNNENIELVEEKAKAGYKSGFADPDYIKVLPTFSLPFLSSDKKYRTFQISGDSMLPIPDKAFVTGEFVQNWNLIRDRQAYIILTYEDGVVFKVVENLLKEQGKLVLYSLNSFYEPYELALPEIREVWRFVHYISPELPDPVLPRNELQSTVAEMKRDIDKIKRQIRL